MNVKQDKIDQKKDLKTLNNGYPVFDFLKYGFIAITISTLLVIASLFFIFSKGFALGQDFTGGTTVEITLSQSISMDQIRETLQTAGYKEATVQQYNAKNLEQQDIIITLPATKQNEVESITENNLAQNLVDLFDEKLDPDATIKRVEFVGPTVGDELATNGTLAIIASLVGIMLYVGFRFEWRFGTSAVIGLAHDVLITCGYLALFQRPIDLTIIAALLSIIGYSLNDTIVVFDRIRENFRKLDASPYDVVNVSLTQTLRRTLITSGTTLIVVIILYIFGGPMLQGFSETLSIGIILGTLSSIYVSAYLAYQFGVKKAHFMQNKIKPEGADFDMSQLN